MAEPNVTDYVQLVHEEAVKSLPFHDTQDFSDAERGFIGKLDPGVVKSADGSIVWDNDSYSFIEGEAPETVNPSLWRQSKLTSKQGLYEVVEGIYQIRGLDLSNMTIVESDNGIIVIDPLISTETAEAALNLYRQYRGDRKVVAVIHTHSHIDHFGGVLGVTSQEDVDAGLVDIVAPEGFVKEAVSENIFAGTAMARRAGYMYGEALERSSRGSVGAGLGQTTSTGEAGLIVPTIDIKETGERHTIDGVEIEFQMAPGTEAPAEMHFYFPQFKALCIAENATHNLHNLLTLRGAVVRDPHVWATYLGEAIARYGENTEVIFASHHWPIWGNERVVNFLTLQRTLYSYLHDQTLRLINRGYTASEAAEVFVLPPALEQAWNARGYYGSVSHNVKAIVQRYLGWFDGNPARLWPHPPEAISQRYVAAMGGITNVIALAQTAYDEGDLRWAATLLDHATFVDPDDQEVRTLYANTLEQLGFSIENGTWRNFFLSGATELREGNFGTPTSTSAPTVMAQLSPEQILDSIAIKIIGEEAWDKDLSFEFDFTDLQRKFNATLRNGTFIWNESPAKSPTLSLKLSKERLLGLLAGDRESPGVESKGDLNALKTLLSVLDPGDPSFNIIVP